MRAARINGLGGRPALVDIAEPEPRPGGSLITVIAGGGGSIDLQGANGVFGPIDDRLEDAVLALGGPERRPARQGRRTSMILGLPRQDV